MAYTGKKSFSEKYFNQDTRRGVTLGAIITAAVLLIGGSYLPGWQLDSTAEKAVMEGQRSVLVTTLAPVCAERFRAQDDLPTQVAALKETNSWARDDFLIDHDWVVLSGIDRSVDQAVGEACADMLEDLVQ